MVAILWEQGHSDVTSGDTLFARMCLICFKKSNIAADMPPKKSKIEGINQKLALVIKSGKVRLPACSLTIYLRFIV